MSWDICLHAFTMDYLSLCIWMKVKIEMSNVKSVLREIVLTLRWKKLKLSNSQFGDGFQFVIKK